MVLITSEVANVGHASLTDYRCKRYFIDFKRNDFREELILCSLEVLLPISSSLQSLSLPQPRPAFIEEYKMDKKKTDLVTFLMNIQSQ